MHTYINTYRHTLRHRTFINVVDFPSIVAAHDGVLYSQAMQVGHCGFLPLRLQVIRHDKSGRTYSICKRMYDVLLNIYL